MNSIFKELLDKGRIDPTPVIEAEGDMPNGYQFSFEGAAMSQSRFETLSDEMSAYSVFNLDPEDRDIFFEITKSNERRAIELIGTDPESAKELLEENQYLRTQMQRRIELSVPLGRSWAFMSFTVIEENENPLVYDANYAKEKIKRWQKYLTAEKKMPFLASMLPIFPDTSKLFNSDTLSYIRTENLETAMQLRKTIIRLGMTGQNNTMIGALESRMEILELYENYTKELLKISTDTLKAG